MIQQTLRKSGNSFVVTIPKKEVERLGLEAGRPIGIYLVPLEPRPDMRPEVRRALDASWERSADLYRELSNLESRDKRE
jgi:antitoxin component of MazEF toxin-antitoxin module